MIEVRHVGHAFGRTGDDRQVLGDVDLAVPDGTFVSIVGPSGCGKTTLLRIIDGLLLPASGRVDIDGRRVGGPSADRALVFQDFQLLPWRDALDNVQFGLEAQGVSRARRKALAAQTLERVGLAEVAHKYPHQLSGGMQQRVGFARALCTSPRYLLMDEPFGSLDLHTRELLQNDLLRWWEEDRRTVLMVTHSVDEAVFLSDRVFVLSAAPCRVEYVLDIHLPRPRWRDDANIRGSSQFLAYRSLLWDKLKQQHSTRELAC
jgi:ABC-type nitrate/sulfonate/bicarbonate transport system ATPase subunit